MERQSGLVFRSTGGQNTVKLDLSNRIIECSIKGKLRLKDLRTTNPVVVGDKVIVEFDNNTNTGTIVNIIERQNYIIRRSTNLSKQAQVLASNIDQIFVVVTINYPPTSLMFIDRLIITAEAYNIQVKILFNKIDLYNKEEIEKLSEYAVIYEKVGYKCFFTSVPKNIGLNEFKNELTDKVSLVAGHSGVGKSSLINWIAPGLNLKTGSISEAHKKGKHTTTFACMHELFPKTYIIDTPGVKAFGLLDIDKDELSHYFPEIFKASCGCKYYNCTHNLEPECNVIKEVENGNIPISRYQNYLMILLNDDNLKYRYDDWE
jgi:ribosome biogenesis GTPase